MKKLLWTLLIVGYVSFTLFAQELSPNVRKHRDVNAAQLARIDTVLKQNLNNNWLVGAVVLIVKDNRVVYHKGFGQANREEGVFMEKDAIFRIMSQTKQITSVAIMQLVDRGVLRLDQRVSDFIPEFRSQKVIKDYSASDTTYTTVPAVRELVIRDLLTHTSGIGYPAIGSPMMKAIYSKAGMPSGLGYFNASMPEKMKLLGSLPLFHQPGEKWTDGLNDDLLGCIIEIVSGKTLDTYFRENIFDPLEMTDTWFTLPSSIQSRLTTVYTEDKTGIKVWAPDFRSIDPSYPLMNKNFFSGGAGLSSTAFDYARFLQMLLNDGKYKGKQILSHRSVEQLLSPQMEDGLPGKDNFGLGFWLVTPKTAGLQVRNCGTFSGGGYFGTTYWADPKEKLICLIMTQQLPNLHADFNEQIANIVYGSLK